MYKNQFVPVYNWLVSFISDKKAAALISKIELIINNPNIGQPAHVYAISLPSFYSYIDLPVWDHQAARSLTTDIISNPNNKECQPEFP